MKNKTGVNNLVRLALLAVIFSLVACQRHLTPAYLLQRPDLLTRYYQNCQNDTRLTIYNLPCEEIIQLNQQFEKHIQEASVTPKLFGLKILKLQQEIGQIKVKMAQKEVENHALAARIKVLETKMQEYYAVIRYTRVH